MLASLFCLLYAVTGECYTKDELSFWKSSSLVKSRDSIRASNVHLSATESYKKYKV